MKKKGIGIIAGILAIGVLAGAGYTAYKMLNEGSIFSDNGNKSEKEEIQEKQEKEEEELKKDIEQDIPDKKPEDIEIPEDATEEEKEELEQEKNYWTIIDDLKTSLMSALPTEDGTPTSIRRINNFYISSNDKLIVDLDYLYTDNNSGRLNQMNITFELGSANELSTSSLENILTYINSDDISVNLLGNTNGKDLDNLEALYENKLKYVGRPGSYIKRGATVELENISCYNYDTAPSMYYTISKVTQNDEIMYVVMVCSSYSDTNGMTIEQWNEYALQAGNYENIMFLRQDTWKGTEINWKEEVAKYSSNAEAGASAASAFETEDGFDYPAYVAAKAENEAKKAESASDETVLVVGENGRIIIKNSDLTF